MNIRQIAIFAAAATLSLGASAAPNIPPRDAAAQVQPRESHMYRLSADEAHHMRNTYGLNDGRELTITSERSQLYAQLDGKTEALVPVARNTFVGRDSHARYTFNDVPFADEVSVEAAAATAFAAQ